MANFCFLAKQYKMPEQYAENMPVDPTFSINNGNKLKLFAHLLNFNKIFVRICLHLPFTNKLNV
jgi:hypothetical protein